jgi:16S rRNA (cytosine967-C5)-methyltransferase
MRDGGRIEAAIGVLTDIERRHRPARLALKGWGLDARYAGAKDRAFVSGLVMDVLRRRRSLAWMMDDGSDRAAVLGGLGFMWDWPLERIAAAAEETHGPGALTDLERARLAAPVDLAGASAPVRGDYPDWLDPHLERVFGEERALEGAALATRAPLDLRVNTLKTDLARTLKALAPFNPETTDLVPNAIRIGAPQASERAPAVETAPEFEKGWFEVQDLGSQWAAARAGDIKGKQVLDLCAGGGGKTLALAAAMANTGQLYAYDSDARRLTDTVRRAQRAGVRNLQVRSPIHPDALAGLEGRMDVVFVDAPCTGSGTWRRHPDTKWRVTSEQLLRRTKEQDDVLNEASAYVKSGGSIIYVTCSLLSDENGDRIEHFITNHPGFVLAEEGRMTPHTPGTDGFYTATLLSG